MKKLNKKGFTLIELLAVIVILGILLAIAVPSVTKYINDSRKSTYVDNVLTYANTARNQASMGDFVFPLSNNEATVITFSELSKSLDKGGKTSPYGYDYNLTSSFVMIVNTGNSTEPIYEYYIAAIDSEGYGIGKTESNVMKAAVVSYNELSKEDIVQIGSKTGVTPPTKSSKITVDGKTFSVSNVYPKD